MANSIHATLVAEGRAYLKRKIFQRVQIDISLLPPNEELLAWLRDEKSRGRRLILATASDYQQACSVAEPFALFDTVLGSDGQRNLKGREKLKTIVDTCGAEFDYVGNSRADLAIWRGCRHAILVNTSRGVERSARRAGNVFRVFPSTLSGFRDALRAMRFYQWVKNLLLFVPAITSHTIFDVSVSATRPWRFSPSDLLRPPLIFLTTYWIWRKTAATPPRSNVLSPPAGRLSAPAFSWRWHRFRLAQPSRAWCPALS